MHACVRPLFTPRPWGREVNPMGGAAVEGVAEEHRTRTAAVPAPAWGRWRHRLQHDCLGITAKSKKQVP